MHIVDLWKAKGGHLRQALLLDSHSTTTSFSTSTSSADVHYKTTQPYGANPMDTALSMSTIIRAPSPGIQYKTQPQGAITASSWSFSAPPPLPAEPYVNRLQNEIAEFLSRLEYSLSGLGDDYDVHKVANLMTLEQCHQYMKTRIYGMNC
jgi:hypothetical protein